ncbi:MAG: transposase, partial [Planctomycetota bacterium]
MVLVGPRAEFFHCANPKCPDHDVLGGNNLTTFGAGGTEGWIPVLKCRTCGERFSVRKGTVLENCQVPVAIAFEALDLLTTGFSGKQVCEETGLHWKTVARLTRKTRAFAREAKRAWPAPSQRQTVELWHSLHKPLSGWEWAYLAFAMPFGMGSAFWAVRPPAWWASSQVAEMFRRTVDQRRGDATLEARGQLAVDDRRQQSRLPFRRLGLLGPRQGASPDRSVQTGRRGSGAAARSEPDRDEYRGPGVAGRLGKKHVVKLTAEERAELKWLAAT